jgi:hypothetical protein
VTEGELVCVTADWVTSVNIAKNVKITLEMGNKVVSASRDSKTLLVSLLDPNKTVFIFKFVNEKRNQSFCPVAGSTPCLSTGRIRTPQKGEVCAENSLQGRDSSSTASAIPLPPLKTWVYSEVARA